MSDHLSNIYREITPLNASDCFTFFKRVKQEFNFPLHTHEEFELNFIHNAAGAKRIVGDNVEVINDLELVLVGSNLPHGWFNHTCQSKDIYEITIQFHRDLFDERLLRRNQLSHVRALLERSSKGIIFSKETAAAFRERIERLTTKSGFDSVLELMSLLHDLSLSRDMRTLSNATFSEGQLSYNSRRIEKAFEFMEAHFDKDIALADVAKVVNMPEVSFSRFIKKRTGRTFIESLNEIRLGHASRLLIDTTQTVAEVSFNSGFNNLSYFNRIFRKKNGCTPTEFRQNYSGTRVFI
ncbi:helix-turn-helix domain-containing protein [Pontibacter akesuensis]|uniref:Helix-turn-helix domain-containing protein n=1 Tax=Pontibacter akesuensis TaxID=388950 RepID=A0A1I7KXL0_9BACT|nr:AraC family transcriptional regulator [Pontibacter akesuensis]GHA78447.1 AraC family transcriptional regulator [Pontibacter akesuensis]SFV02242.1 Helix-turn-helix domain-containing protein [Pontibacter akesuensis]